MGISSSKLKSLNEAISELLVPTERVDVVEAYVNSLTAKARQAIFEKKQEEEEEEETPEEEKKEDETEMLMKKLAAKALKRARKKAATNEEVELAEKAAPGYEDWASDPKVKASFKKQYGKRWKQVMYAKSWKMSKMDEGYSDYDKMMPSALRHGVKTHDKFKGTKSGVKPNPANPKKFASGRLSHQMTPAEYKSYFGRPKPMSESDASIAEALEQKLEEGSRGAQRLKRIMKSVKKNYAQGKAMIGTRNANVAMRELGSPGSSEAKASRAALNAGVAHMEKKKALRGQISSRTRAAAMRERGRAGLNPRLHGGSSIVSANTTGGYEYTENPKRVPSAVKTYRKASAVKRNMYR